MAPVMCSAETSAQPDQIGKYRILGTLGQGAMGRVYLGEDPHIGRKVAVKVLSGATGDEARARFLEEARTIGHLSHPEIVTLLEFGFHEGQPFLAMEHLEGESFERWLARRPPEAAVLGVLVALCRAIDHAHAQGVLHRDVKPSNLQVLDDGRAKLLDFGIARAGSVALTATGMLMGTPQYLAPEVLNGEGHSTASDVYAVGLVVYEALTGLNPFAAGTLEQCLTRVLTSVPEPLAALRPDLEPELAGAVQACVARRPADRPATLEPLRRALEARIASGSDSLGQPTVRLRSGARPAPSAEGSSATVVTGSGRPADSSGSRLPGWSRWAAGAIALLGAAGALAWVLAGPGASEPSAAGSAERPAAAARVVDDRAAAEDRRPELEASTEPAPEGLAEEQPARQDLAGEDAVAGAQPTRTEPARRSEPRAATTGGDTAGSPPARGGPAPSDTAASAEARSADGPAPLADLSAEIPSTGSPLASEDRSETPGGGQTGTGFEPPIEAPAETGTGTGTGTGTQASPVAAGTPDPEAPTRPDSTETATPTADRAAASAPAPRLDRLAPAVIRRGGVATLVVEGAAFADGLAVEVRRGDTAVPGIRVRRIAVRDAGRIRLTLFVAPDVPLGLYSVVVVAPDGRTSNPTELEVSL